MSRKYPCVRTRLLARLVINPGTYCWEWTGCTNVRGYGYIKRNGVQCYTHRIAYELWYGPIPDGLQIDHLCRNTKCANPDHLEVTTGQINTLRSDNPAAVNSRKTRCDNNHEFTEENTYTRPDGSRTCRQCHKDSWNKTYAEDPARFAQHKRNARLRDPEGVRARERESANRQRAKKQAEGPARTAPETDILTESEWAAEMAGAA